MASLSQVCAFAQPATCRFGSSCKFKHAQIADFFNGRPNTVPEHEHKRKRKRSHTDTPNTKTPLDEFFAKYPSFHYTSSASASSEFYRMCDVLKWGSNDKARKKAHSDFKDALVHQFNNIYGTDVNNLNAWRDLCQIVRVSPIPDTLESCREAVRKTHVNIVDLIDTKTTGKPVELFPSEMKLSEYTKERGKFFPRDNAYAGGLLKYLLRRIMNPRPDIAYVYRKAQSNYRRR